MNKIIIAIDGFAGCGKSSTARAVASRLGYLYVDTGAMYRAVTLSALRNGISPYDSAGLIAHLPEVKISFVPSAYGSGFEVALNGVSVEDEIRSLEVSAAVSEVSAVKEIRRELVRMQQEIGHNSVSGIVMDGRDIGTVVFPDAELKIFMLADLEARVQRRKIDLLARKQYNNDEEIRQNLIHRDHLDTTRTESPLRQSPQARVLDTSHLQFDEQVEKILVWVKELEEVRA